MNCRFCGNELSHEFIDLLESPLSNSFLTEKQLNQAESYFPLKLFVCDKCFLVQIDEYKSAKEIFNNEYIYFSSYSKSWLEHAKKYTEMMLDRFAYDKNSLVVEIASNDGYLLQYFNNKQIPVLGIEPTLNTAKVASDKGIETITEFFGVELAKNLAEQNKLADLLIGNNVLAHVPDINDFVGGLKIGLKPDGIVTMEFPHLVQLIENNQFDTIYHEHFSYLSLTTVKFIFEAHKLKLFDVEQVKTHGGSLRIFAKHSDDNTKPVSSNLLNLLKKEEHIGLKDLSYYMGFQKKAQRAKDELLSFLKEQNDNNKLVVAYGAAAKGNTLLNYCGVKSDVIKFVVDASPYKQGKFLPGSHIPVVNENEIRKKKPDFVIILPWNIREEISTQLSYIYTWGGSFVVAIPTIEAF
ncbi:MAG: methyltransferase domain-containing protein [Candidatus Scalindua sediminis]|nr:methyltransferase domain-containing protein [Candidatus Scalindua sediminis]